MSNQHGIALVNSGLKKILTSLAMLAAIKRFGRNLLTFHGDYLKILSIQRRVTNFSCSLFKGEDCRQALLRSFFIGIPLFKGSSPKCGCFNDHKAIVITVWILHFFFKNKNQNCAVFRNKYASFVVRSLSVQAKRNSKKCDCFLVSVCVLLLFFSCFKPQNYVSGLNNNEKYSTF